MSIIDMFKRLISGTSAGSVATSQTSGPIQTFSERDKIVAQECAVSALRVFTESLNIANQSKNLATRESRLQVARDKLIELKKMEKQFPFLHLENLKAVEASIAEVEAETRELVRVQNASLPSDKTVGELQSEPLSAWGNDDIITGLQFCATLQLRTPLRVLLRHGEIHTDRKKAPPEIINEAWEGIWSAKTKTYRELGHDIDEPPPSMQASDIGPILADDYLPFLIAVRKIVEFNDTIENRIEKLREIQMVDDCKPYIEKHGGIEKIIRYFFPRFVDTIPSLNQPAEDELYNLGLNTPYRIEAAPDQTLLSIKGIGQAKLKTIRDYCAGITDKRDADRAEDVIR